MTQSTHKVDVVPKLDHASHYNPVTFATKNIWHKKRHVNASGGLSVKAELHLCHILFYGCLKIAQVPKACIIEAGVQDRRYSRIFVALIQLISKLQPSYFENKQILLQW